MSQRAARRPLVAGNWKMNPATRAEALALARDVARATRGVPVDTVICPPAIWLVDVAGAVGDDVGIGAQTMHAEERGAFTGELSALMLDGIAGYVILGHSERRQYDCETDAAVGRKVASAVRHGLRPIAAVGERADERRTGLTDAVVTRQLRAAIAMLDAVAGSGLAIAYEPVWAIGTGDAASPADAQAVAGRIRELLREVDPRGAEEVPILYGGSVTASNAAGFFAQPDLDGALVGGASLSAEAFGGIVHAAAAARA